ncbi:MBL fold metallo-hydrolase [Paractinoplanes brasiliensis]|uniref:L-ascorbate metabolism protein UlaG (Beta-lactamase superfamily) n=1 Tax=Paractinoplanes brasiliensis TaxID=52695 RepID=A0A4R6JU39_9ACTN|nr:MBL fold metallo-hydrolase [Actinoplanes brasiliensis]TDO40210.1 L-ascorbate metabolism protein UlaG (beta-lactamase superfamily) [Actinoplanes brasiliensis]GID25276.1 MBL fold metallo-hydrolase [Actinoplanes brasiliensis]
MQITKFTHSCLRIEGAGVLVVDPGAFSERAALDGADAVLITHEHFDHLDPEALTETLEKRPGLRIYAHADVLAQHPRFAEASTAVEPGGEFEAAGYRVRVHGGQHAVIHPDIPRIANVGYLIADGSTNLYHPGDSFTVPEDTTVDTLFAPLNAPWMKLSESIDFVRAVKPGRAYALHDHLLTETGAKVSDGHLERLSGTKYAHLAPGTTIA